LANYKNINDGNQYTFILKKVCVPIFLFFYCFYHTQISINDSSFIYIGSDAKLILKEKFTSSEGENVKTFYSERKKKITNTLKKNITQKKHNEKHINVIKQTQTLYNPLKERFSFNSFQHSSVFFVSQDNHKTRFSVLSGFEPCYLKIISVSENIILNHIESLKLYFFKRNIIRPPPFKNLC